MACKKCGKMKCSCGGMVKKPMKKAMGGMVNRPPMSAQAAGRGIGQGVSAMAQAPGRTGGMGQQVSAMAQRPGFKKGGMVGKMPRPERPTIPPNRDAMTRPGKPDMAGKGPSWKPAKTGDGNYGKAVSAAAQARNAARKAAAGGRGEAMKAKMGEMKAKMGAMRPKMQEFRTQMQAWRDQRPQRPEGAGRDWRNSEAVTAWRSQRPQLPEGMRPRMGMRSLGKGRA
jgi:hypothetical protein